MYAYDDMLKAQKRVVAMQKKQLHMKEPYAIEKSNGKVQDISSIFNELNTIENDINLTKRDLDEYMSFTGNSIRNIPTLHNISPLSRKIYSQLKSIHFKDIPEEQLTELNRSGRRIVDAWNSLRVSYNQLIRMGPGGNPRPKDEPFRRLYVIAKDDLNTLQKYVFDQLKNVKGHNYLLGSGIEKRFL
jgi:hypothetical protein